MLAHVVLLKPRADLPEPDRVHFVQVFEDAVRAIPAVRSVQAGRRVRHGAGYEPSAPDVDYLAIIEFDDVNGLQAYLRHPAHTELGRLFGTAFETALAYDFEMGNVSSLMS